PRVTNRPSPPPPPCEAARSRRRIASTSPSVGRTARAHLDLIPHSPRDLTQGGRRSMSMTLDLSATLRGKLASVARRVRLLRAVRGTALLLLTLAVTAGLALLADYAFTLAPVLRGILLALWVGLGSFVALFGLLL